MAFNSIHERLNCSKLTTNKIDINKKVHFHDKNAL